MHVHFQRDSTKAVSTINSFAGKIHVSVLWGNVFVKQFSEFDKQEGFSSEKCVVDYQNAVYSGLTK